MNKKIKKKDKEIWLDFVNSKTRLHDKEKNIKTSSKIIKEKKIDLHGYSLNNANKTIDYFISKCFDEGVKKIVVITGKGSRSNHKDDPYKSKDLGILKYSVPAYIQAEDSLMKMIKEINLNQIKNINFGSFEIYLKNK